MSGFDFSKVRDYLPKELPKIDLSRVPTWPSIHTSMNPDDDQNPEGVSGSFPERDDLDDEDGPSMVLTEPTPIQPGPKSNLDLMNECDNFPYYHVSPKTFAAHMDLYYVLQVKQHPDVGLGYMLPSVVEVFRGLPDWKVDDTDRTLVLMAGDTEEERSRAVEATVGAMRATNHFRVLKGWRDELYPIYGPNRKLLFSMERAASALFGIVTYGCHMTAYTRTPEGQMKIWVPRRAKSKQTYGGMLDNTVAGGIATGEKVFESMIREAQEEASLPEDIVRSKAKAVGTVTYFHIRDRRAGGETRLLMPECQYVYDLELDEDVVPKPSDTEVEGFELMTVEETKEAMRSGEFKPNCALVLLDFFVRHGFLTAEDEGYIEIVARLHRRLEFPTL